MWAGNEKLRLVTFLQKCDEKCSLKVAKVSTTIGRVAKNGFGNILSRTKSDICTLGNTAFEWLKIYFAKATLHTYKLPLWTFANFLKPSENYKLGQNWFIRSNREFGKKKVLVSGKMLAYCQNCGICLKNMSICQNCESFCKRYCIQQWSFENTLQSLVIIPDLCLSMVVVCHNEGNESQHYEIWIKL